MITLYAPERAPQVDGRCICAWIACERQDNEETHASRVRAGPRGRVWSSLPLLCGAATGERRKQNHKRIDWRRRRAMGVSILAKSASGWRKVNRGSRCQSTILAAFVAVADRPPAAQVPAESTSTGPAKLCQQEILQLVLHSTSRREPHSAGGSYHRGDLSNADIFAICAAETIDK